MANILILGAGSMGTAFSYPCSDNKHSVVIIGTHLEDDFIDKINLQKKHPSLESPIPKNVKFLKFKNLKDEATKTVDLIVVAVISKGIDWVSSELSKVIKENTPILILTKGMSLHNDKYEVLANKMKRIFKSNGIENSNISAAGGPCLAKGLSKRIHTSVIFANEDISVVKKIAKLIATDYYHISVSDDIIGVEICAAIKNIFSMAVGSSQGLCHNSLSKDEKEQNYLNTAASLMQQSINEMVIFTERFNGKKETVMGLAGIGDLYVSADGGRNSKMGEYLGQGISFIDAKKNNMPSVTVEGADLALEIGEKTKKIFSVKELPLMIAMINTICNGDALKFEWINFFAK